MNISLIDARALVSEFLSHINHSVESTHEPVHAQCANLVKACEVLEFDGDMDDQDSVETMITVAPFVFNFDIHGNWVGSVANENGFTN